MSRTMVKNGSEVQRAIYHLSVGQGGVNKYLTVSQVAKEARLCKATTRKYIQILREYDCVSVIDDNGYCMLVSWAGR